MAGDHLVLVGLRLANPLWLDVTKLFSHFLKLKFADRAWEVVELDVIAMVAEVAMVKRGVPQPTVGHTCQDKYLGAELNTRLGPDI